MNVTLEVYESDNATLVGEVEAGQFYKAKANRIPLKGGAQVVIPRLVVGAAGFIVTLSDNPAMALLTIGRLLRFTGDFGTFTIEIEDLEDTVVSPQSEAGEVVVVSGRDWLTARAAKSPVLPDAGMGNLPWHPTRWFNFAADRLRDDDPDGPQGAWPFSYGQLPNYDSDNYFGRPEGFVDTAGPDGDGPEWLWDQDSRTAFAAGGVCYFRQRFTLDDAQTVIWQFAADDEGELWVDDVPVCRIEGVYKGGAVSASLEMSDGEHLIGVWGRNRNELRAGVVYAAWSVSDGMPDTLLVRSDASLARCLAYPDDPPGFTPPEVIRLAVDEVQTAGGLAGVGFSFLSSVDTASQAVTEVTDLAITAPGSSLLTLLELLAATYLDIDCRHDDGHTDAESDPCDLMVDCWIRGTRGTDKTATVSFGKGTASLVKPTYTGSERATVALVTGANFAPFTVEANSTAVDDYGYLTVPLDFGDASAATARRWALAYLREVLGWRLGIQVQINPGGLVPGADFDIGDSVALDVAGGETTWGGVPATWGDDPIEWTDAHRVAGWGFDLDASSVVRYSVELAQPAAETEERLAAFMRRYAPGGAGGRTLLPSKTEPQFPSQQAGSEQTETWSAGTTGTVVLRKNGVAITGASVTGGGKVTLTAAAREFVAGSDVIDFTIDGEAGFPEWKPPSGRWLQEMSVTDSSPGCSVTVRYV